MSRTRKRMYSIGGGANVMQGKNPNIGYAPPKLLCSETCVDSTHPGPPYRSGGPLDVAKKTMSYGYTRDVHWRAQGTVAVEEWNGSFWVTPTHSSDSPPSAISLAGWGAKGYNRGLPVHDELNFGQYIGEMKDAGQMLSSTYNFFSQFASSAFSGRSAKFWSEAYLNYQFGWAPFLNDLKSVLDAQQRLARRVDWIRKHNGKNIKRKFTLSQDSFTELDSQTENTSLVMQPIISRFAPTSGGAARSVTYKHVKNRIWFAGCFTFHVPNTDLVGPVGSFRMATMLSGLAPDMNLIYKLTPWSWLFDWFSSAGAAVNNWHLMNQYFQVARYAYVMRSVEIEYRTYAFQRVMTGQVPNLVPTLVSASAKTKLVRKQREVASPYGFGFTWDGLNPFQMSILTALGITRSR